MGLVLFEDTDFIAVQKPAGVPSHRVAELAPEGFYEFVRRRFCLPELGLHQRLDKQTSGVMIFAKTPAGNKTLSAQFATDRIEKTYFLLSAHRVSEKAWTCREPVGGKAAVTEFEFIEPRGELWLYRAHPKTGRTHQIRIHAAHSGCPVAGDQEYGGTKKGAGPFARMYLHAGQIAFFHPTQGTSLIIESPLPEAFTQQTMAQVARDFAGIVFDETQTNAYRLMPFSQSHPAKVSVDLYKQFALVNTEDADALTPEMLGQIESAGAISTYRKILERHLRGQMPSPEHAAGMVMNDLFSIRENGLRYLISFQEGYSTGLFLDQRENRHELGVWCKARGRVEVLNAFSYTCGFSLVAAAAGAKTTSLDLSTKYLDWGKKNFTANGLDAAEHDFIFGDALDWMKRLGKKGRKFDCVILDPPTFSTNKQGRVFRADKNYGELVALALKLVKRPGVLFCSSNMATLKPFDFKQSIRTEIQKAGRKILFERFQAEPFDFILPDSPSFYLKTFWFELQ